MLLYNGAFTVNKCLLESAIKFAIYYCLFTTFTRYLNNKSVSLHIYSGDGKSAEKVCDVHLMIFKVDNYGDLIIDSVYKENRSYVNNKTSTFLFAQPVSFAPQCNSCSPRKILFDFASHILSNNG